MTRELTTDDIETFRARLIETATAMFAEIGVQDVSLRSLAARMGVSRSTPYRYFRDLEEILGAVREAALRRLTACCQAAIEAEDDPIERILAAGRGYLEFARSEPNAFRVLFDLRQTPPAESAGFAEALAEHGRVSKGPVRAAAEAGLLRGDADEVARALWAHVHGIAALQAAGVMPDDISVERLWTVAKDIARRGMVIDTVN